MKLLLARLGAASLAQVAGLGMLVLLLGDILKTAFTRRPRWRVTLDQIYRVGWQSQAMVIITGAFTGMVFAVQTGLQFH